MPILSLMLLPTVNRKTYWRRLRHQNSPIDPSMSMMTWPTYAGVLILSVVTFLIAIDASDHLKLYVHTAWSEPWWDVFATTIFFSILTVIVVFKIRHKFMVDQSINVQISRGYALIPALLFCFALMDVTVWAAAQNATLRPFVDTFTAQLMAILLAVAITTCISFALFVMNFLSACFIFVLARRAKIRGWRIDWIRLRLLLEEYAPIANTDEKITYHIRLSAHLARLDVLMCIRLVHFPNSTSLQAHAGRFAPFVREFINTNKHMDAMHLIRIWSEMQKEAQGPAFFPLIPSTDADARRTIRFQRWKRHVLRFVPDAYLEWIDPTKCIYIGATLFLTWTIRYIGDFAEQVVKVHDQFVKLADLMSRW